MRACVYAYSCTHSIYIYGVDVLGDCTHIYHAFTVLAQTLAGKMSSPLSAPRLREIFVKRE